VAGLELYKANETKVLDLMRRMGSAESSILLAIKFYDALNQKLEEYTGCITGTVVREMAYACGRYYPQRDRLYLERLADVFETGNVLFENVVHLPCTPSDKFTDLLNEYLESISSENSRTNIGRINDSCRRFYSYMLYKGISALIDIDYDFLYCYYQEWMKRAPSSSLTDVYRVARFLDYSAGKNMCSAGFSFFLQNLSDSRVVFLEDLSDAQRDIIKKLASDGPAPDIEKLVSDIRSFLTAMEEHGYSEENTGNARKCLTRLLVFLDMNSLGYSDQAARAWLSARQKIANRIMAVRTVDLFTDYVETGALHPEKCRISRMGGVDSLTWGKDDLNGYIKQKTLEKLDESTIKMIQAACLRFLHYLESKGITDYAGITPAIVKAFNKEDSHQTPAAKNAYNSRIRKYLLYLSELGKVSSSLSEALPSSYMPGKRMVVTLSEEELQKIREYRESAARPIELRTAAIMTIGIETGLRGCDIVNLEFDDIDWSRKCLRVFQDKTDVEFWVPFGNRVGNSIYHYMKEGRDRRSGSSKIFISTKAPFGQLHSSACLQSLKRVLPGREIRGSGFHVTRKTFATRMLRGGAEKSLIADGMGHTTTGNLQVYLSLDAERMKACPLPLGLLGLGVLRYD
jgi:site-specific recombinase XerD